MSLRLWPRTLAARTAVVLLLGLALVQVAGLTIHAFDRIDLQRYAFVRDVAVRSMTVYRAVVLTPPLQRGAVLQEMPRGPALSAELSDGPPLLDMPELPPHLQHELQVNMRLVPLPPILRPHDLRMLGGPGLPQLVIGMQLPDGDWLNLTVAVERPRPWHWC